MNNIHNIPYHQPAFLHLMRIFADEIRYVLIKKSAEFRGRQFLARFPPGQMIGSDVAWEGAREILDNLDGEMRTIISRRSVAYWLHLYRRIGVYLSPDHEDKTDHVTVALVRQIGELAIQKHGLLTGHEEFALSDKLSPDQILGGWMKKGLKSLGGNGVSGERVFREYSIILKNKPNWVIRDFSKKDFLDIYALEGAAYQYWRVTALLRSLGKGAEIVVDETGDWDYVPNLALTKLIVSVDKRNERRNSLSSLTGVWIDQETIIRREENDERKSELDIVFFPTYNTSRVKLTDEFEFFGVRFPNGFVPNFFPLYFMANVFFKHHHFMLEQFTALRGYDFDLLVKTLAGLSSFSILPSSALYTDNEAEREQIKLAAFMQTLSRGYHLFNGSEADLLEMLIKRMSIIFSKELDNNEVRELLASVTLNEQVQRRISPWSNGPRCVIIPSDSFCVVDLVSLPALLHSIFAFMTDRFGQSGTVFEKLFKEALGRRGFNVESGVLVGRDGSERELDAGVLVGDRMYLFECVSIERPLDYEIGRPKTLAVREQRLLRKLDQAKSLHAFVSKNPSGRNYDFSGAREFVWAVVSPFVEWIWDLGSELWLDSQFPRILAPDEAFSLLGKNDD
jgi:hypothetical protein